MADDFRMLKPFHFSYTGTDNKIRNMTYPFRLPNADAKLNFRLVIRKSIGSSNCAGLNGLHIIIHSGNDMDRFDKIFYYVPLNQHGYFSIQFQLRNR